MSARKLSEPEFVGLVALLFATIAFSVDTMLPALPDIGAELSPANPNNAQFVVTAFVLGMGIGTLIVGPISDAYGRKPVIFAGAVLFFAGCLMSYQAQSMSQLVWGRVLG